MFELKIRDYCFIAHSLNDDFFGPAKNLHGVTYVVDMTLSSKDLIEKNVIIDIGLATEILKKVLDKYNYKNLDDIEDLKGNITTTEFMAKQLADDIYCELESRGYPIKKLFSIKVNLKENHLASASFTKLV